MAAMDLTKALQSALTRLLKPLVRILLRNGVSFGVFAEYAKRVYVDVASEEFVIPGKAQTTSRISTLTGLTRKDVQRIKELDEDDDQDLSARYNRAARVITAWTRESSYLDATGQPLALPFDKAQPSFSSLVKAASGDITPRTILDELLHVGAIRAQSDGLLHLKTRAYIPHGDNIEKVGILGSDVHDLIATIDHNLKAAPGTTYFQRKVCYDNLPEEVMDELRQIIETKAQAALESMNEDMVRCDRDSNPAKKGHGRVRAGLGIYYFQENDIDVDKDER